MTLYFLLEKCFFDGTSVLAFTYCLGWTLPRDFWVNGTEESRESGSTSAVASLLLGSRGFELAGFQMLGEGISGLCGF